MYVCNIFFYSTLVLYPLVHYYESVQPQMNSILSSSESLMNHLTSENFIHIVENLSEYSIPCPVK